MRTHFFPTWGILSMGDFILIIILIFVSDVLLVESGVIFTLSSDTANWATAKSNCEALGQTLAVLNSAAKQSALESQM